MSEEDYTDEFYTVIQANLDPKVVKEGDGWLIAKLMPDVYEVIMDGTTVALVESSKAIDRIGKSARKEVIIWESTKLDDNGRTATTVLLQ